MLKLEKLCKYFLSKIAETGLKLVMLWDLVLPMSILFDIDKSCKEKILEKKQGLVLLIIF